MDLFSKANEAFVSENYEDAIELYSKAIESESGRDDIYVNRSHAYFKIENYEGAVNDADKAIDLNPTNSKAYFRKGLASFFLADYVVAKTALEKAQEMEGKSSDKLYGEWIRKCQAEIDSASSSNMSENKQVDIGFSALPATDHSKSENEANKQQNINTVSAQVSAASKTRYDWYQTETQVIISIMVKNVKKEDVSIDVQEKSFNATMKLPNGEDFSLELDLAHDVFAEKSIIKVLTSKIEVKLKKQEGIRWTKLERDVELEKSKVKHFHVDQDSSAAHKYPSSAHYTRDWDKLVTDIKNEEKDEKLEGDAALNQLFQQIYADGSDEVKKAMNKSFSESGGTVLSTNWKDIGGKKTEIKPPDGMEYKKYEV